MSAIADRLSDLELRGALRLPLPGSGETWSRWQQLADITRRNVVLGRLAEAHCDALAILAEFDESTPLPGELWGVWAAEPPSPVLEATREGDGWVLNGTKPWCSGASICTHALVTARVPEGRRLFAVDLRKPWATAVPDTWHAVGMAESDSGAVEFADADATPIGAPGAYLTRSGFWHGAIGVAACWYGGACSVADELHRHARRGGGDDHTAAHLGAVAAALHTARDSLIAAAAAVDADPTDEYGYARIRARSVRAIVERSATEVLDRVGRALGPAPLCSDAVHAHRVADLTVYLRQSHAERDLAALGHDLAALEQPW